MDSTTATAPTVWGVFVGYNGDQLEIFNSKHGPFPPKKESDGYIAIGWPAIGYLPMFKGDYADYVEKFRVVYPHDSGSERAFKTQANMPWHFAFEMAKGDWVICPCSAHSLLLVGEVIGEYEHDYHGKLGFYGKRRVDFVHARKVRWKEIILKTDKRYHQLNRIGQLTVTRPQITFAELQAVLGSAAAAA
jgi:predicted Mrr-cat superfamily restriction endonuclease